MATKKKIKTKTSKSMKVKPSAEPKGSRKAVTRKKDVAERERGPASWFLPTVESTYTKLKPRDFQEQPAALANGTKGVTAKPGFTSALQLERGEEVLAAADQNFWRDRLTEYKKRKAQAAGLPLAPRTSRIAPGAPVIAGATNWAPLGPSVVTNGQAQGDPPVAGRISGVAVAPGGLIVYAASANGGVFRSDDGGISWTSLMDGFDLAPTDFASTSLAKQHMRRVDCRNCGVVVEQVPWGDGKHPLTRAYAVQQENQKAPQRNELLDFTKTGSAVI